MIKVLHTSDWHLGRTLHGYDLLDMQVAALEQIETAALVNSVDVIMIAGDVFDRSVPAAGALTLFGDFVERLSGKGLRLIVIPGNHDSAERLSFLSNMMKKNGIHVVAGYDSETILIEKNGLCVKFHPLPYIFDELGGTKVAAALESISSSLDNDAINILIAHLFTAGGISSESERFSGASAGISPELFSAFDYSALGHLHRPQTVVAGVRYCGSIFPYSVTEADHQKSVTLLEIRSKEDIEICEIPLVGKRSIVRLSGSLSDFCDTSFAVEHTDDFVEAVLRDETLVANPAEMIRGRFPYLLSVRQPLAENELRPVENYQSISPHEVFSAFYQTVSGEEADESLITSFLAAFAEVNR